jgi:hypothetical protein
VEQVAAALQVSLVADDLRPRGGQHRLGLRTDQRLQLGGLLGQHRRDVADGVRHELPVLPRHDVGSWDRLEAGRS